MRRSRGLGDVYKRQVQYISIVQAGTMDQVQTVGSTDVVIAAVVIDGVRLIDNMSFANA
jgi:pantothenate synthetase